MASLGGLVNKTGPSKLDQQALDEDEADQIFAQNVLKRTVNWQNYAESKLITAQDAGLLTQYDKNNVEEQNDLLDEQGKVYAAVFVKALTAIQAVETKQYLLTLVAQLLDSDPSRAEYFHAIACELVNPFQPFMRILRATDEDTYTVGKAVHILSVLLQGTKVEEVTEYMQWLCRQLRVAKGRRLVHVLTGLKDVLKSAEAALNFTRADSGGEDGLDALIALAGDTQNTQQLYLVWFCVWLLSYHESLFPFLATHDVIQKLVNTVKLVIREKVVRVAFATLRNLLDHDRFNEQMIGNGLVKVLETLSSRKWKDDDLVADMKVIATKLVAVHERLSSFEMYQAEIATKNLSWSPVHSEQFWRENIMKFEKANFELIRQLVVVLGSATEDVRLEVACYDLGEFARFYPGGKIIVQKLGGKTLLMGHMASQSPKVSKQALLAVQKLLVENWESLAGGGVASLASKSGGR